MAKLIDKTIDLYEYPDRIPGSDLIIDEPVAKATVQLTKDAALRLAAVDGLIFTRVGATGVRGVRAVIGGMKGFFVDACITALSSQQPGVRTVIPSRFVVTEGRGTDTKVVFGQNGAPWRAAVLSAMDGNSAALMSALTQLAIPAEAAFAVYENSGADDQIVLPEDDGGTDTGTDSDPFSGG